MIILDLKENGEKNPIVFQALKPRGRKPEVVQSLLDTPVITHGVRQVLQPSIGSYRLFLLAERHS